jgi:uncharacterized membrane protein YphA (DoxX/SURF4 family)
MGQTAPQFVQSILEYQWTWPIARLALVVYYLVSGVGKIADFRGGVSEMAQAGMPAPAAMTVLSIFVELTGSVLVLTGRWVWLGAGMLGVFTATGAVTAHAFWRESGQARLEAIAVFLMHLGLVAAFVLCALVAEREGRAAQVATPSASRVQSGGLCPQVEGGNCRPVARAPNSVDMGRRFPSTGVRHSVAQNLCKSQGRGSGVFAEFGTRGRTASTRVGFTVRRASMMVFEFRHWRFLAISRRRKGPWFQHVVAGTTSALVGPRISMSAFHFGRHRLA